MLSVDEALAKILSCTPLPETEDIALDGVSGRVAAGPVEARITQPPFAASAMDGYAVRLCDAKAKARLKIIGEAPAGAPFNDAVGAGEAVRIFTGAVVPQGADHVVIQENTHRDNDHVILTQEAGPPHHIRAAGVDFKKGDRLANAGDVLHEIHGALFAAANIEKVRVRRRPIAALFSNGDELREPGAALAAGEIINSNHYALSALIKSWGGEARYLGCAADSEAAIRDKFTQAQEADIIIPIGGASVGDYDYVKSAFREAGGGMVFEKIAVRPGKPTWFGALGGAHVLGLPGNPASAIVTAALFAQPLVRRLAGVQNAMAVGGGQGVLTTALNANGAREAYLRGVANYEGVSHEGSRLLVTPAPDQDSSLLAPFAAANVLIRRRSNAPAAHKGDKVEFVWLR